MGTNAVTLGAGGRIVWKNDRGRRWGRPPRSSALTTSPVAALTRGGPPRKMVPLPLTMMLSSDMAGT